MTRTTWNVSVTRRVKLPLFPAEKAMVLQGLEGDRNGAARASGFSLHAGVDVAAKARETLERLCRYIVRPPVATECLALTASGPRAPPVQSALL